jgi:hypothetical protein
MLGLHDILLEDRHIREAQQRIKEQKARLHRMIVQGCATQSADDTLRDMELAFRQMKEQCRIPR